MINVNLSTLSWLRSQYFLIILLVLAASQAQCKVIPPANVTSDFNSHWRLLLDRNATWEDDALYLPDDVNLSKIPINPPTFGWSALDSRQGIDVNLPSTVEEHSTSAVSYHGVSWWYRPFTAPVLRPGDHLVFSFPGARLRAEVYVNDQLVGYNIISEIPFEAGATNALKPGRQNLIAVRITNPGGRLDWIDYLTMQWGKYTLPATHDFGGLNGGVRMEVRSAINVNDLTVLNTQKANTVVLNIQVNSYGPAYNGKTLLSISRFGKRTWSGSTDLKLAAGKTIVVHKIVTIPSATLWDIGKPALYLAKASIPSYSNSTRTTRFGFRWFTPSGVGTDAMLRLNGHRIVPRSAISWGFWAPNGIFPNQADVDREVSAVKALGLDCIQNHRHFPKQIVLDTFDRAGLMRSCEPGGGVFTFGEGTVNAPSTSNEIDSSGTGGEPKTFLSRYELAKVLGMIQSSRSHPSIIAWTLQNEESPDLHNPAIFYTLRKMREADPSRIILLKSGIFSGNQVWSMPYANDWRFDNGSGISGWSDDHTAMSSAGVYQDNTYQSPTNFEYRTNNKTEIKEWGEMATGASPDNHAIDIAWYAKSKRNGYDKASHETILSSYNEFLDKYQFRDSFPTATILFTEAGNKHYFSAARVMENARICDANDYIVLSGWESTAIDDHSGLVDSLRLLKGNPSLLKSACAPMVLVVRPLHYVVALGDKIVCAIHLINEDQLHGAFRLNLVADSSDGKKQIAAPVPITIAGGDVFAQLLDTAVRFNANLEGNVKIKAEVRTVNDNRIVLSGSANVLVVNTEPAPITKAIAVAGDVPEAAEALQTKFHLDTTQFSATDSKLSKIISFTTGNQSAWQQLNDTSTTIQNTLDPGLFSDQLYGLASTIRTYKGLANGTATVDLYFAETYFQSPGQRAFDVALNGKTVLKNLDIFQQAGGDHKALIETFKVDLSDGVLSVSIPQVEANNATIAAIRITEANGQVIREVFRGTDFIDRDGHIWTHVPTPGFDWNSMLPDALRRVHDDGTQLVLVTSGGTDSAAAASALASKNILEYAGQSGEPGPSWEGFWYFAKKTWMLQGLPSGCVLDWPYQIGTGNGLFLNGSAVNALIGYGKNHDPHIGIGAAEIKYGTGKIVLLAIPGLERAFLDGDPANFQPVTAKRIIYNLLSDN